MKKSIILSILSVIVLASCSMTNIDTDTVVPQSQQDTTGVLPTRSDDGGTHYKMERAVTLYTTNKVAGYNYEMFVGMPMIKGGYSSGYYNTVKSNSGVDFLTNVTTMSVSNTNSDDEYNSRLIDMGLFYTEDLNSAARGSYVRIGFQGQRENTSAFHYYTNRLDKRQDESKVVTGLALVTITDGSDAPSTITDSEGIKWILAPSYTGSSDLNNGTKKHGDALYLYFTTDYTGRQITVTNPYFIENYDRLQNNNLMTAMLGGITTWTGSDDNAWKPSVDALLSGVASKVWNDTQVQEDDHAIQYNVDFVRLYDKTMTPIQGDEQYRPAQFNRNAGGHKIFVSYSYITEKSDYWVNQ